MSPNKKKPLRSGHKGKSELCVQKVDWTSNQLLMFVWVEGEVELEVCVSVCVCGCLCGSLGLCVCVFFLSLSLFITSEENL